MTAIVIRRIPLHGIPCSECGLPATGMDTAGTWTRVWHAQHPLMASAYCDIGTPPERPHGAGETPCPHGRPE